MRETVTYVTQSKFFSPAFNAAIFDGPIRIYFAQYQESQALKVYFQIQERFQDERKSARGIFKDRARNIFVMLYPTTETFELSFGGAGSAERLALVSETSLSQSAGAYSGRNIARSKLGADFIIGVRGPLDDEEFTELYQEMDSIVRASEA